MSIGMQTVRPRVLSAIIFTVLFTGSVLAPHVASAATYYVATTGSDANSGSQSQPFQTIDKGVSVLHAGDTLYIRGGTYSGNNGKIQIDGKGGTSWSNPITIAGYPGETVILNGHGAGIGIYSGGYWIFDRLTIDANPDTGGIWLNCPAHHIKFENGEVIHNTISGCGNNFEVRNCKVHHAVGYGWYWGGQDSIFENNHVYDNTGYAFHVYSSGSTSVTNNIVRNNIIHGNGFGSISGYGGVNGGLLISSGSDNKAYNNVLYNNFAGIQVDYRCTNCQVYNNTIYGNTETAGITIGSSAVNTIVKNNLVYRNRGGITNDGDAGAVIDHNWTDSDGDPKFVNAAANDFHLQSTSPAIDTGVILSTVPTDLDSIARPQGARYDIGAYEYQVSTVPAPLPAPKNLRATSVVP